MKPLNPALTPGSARMLKIALDENEEFVAEGLQVWVGAHRTSYRVLDHLLRECLVRDVTLNCSDSPRYYAVAEDDARRALADPTYETRWREHQRTGKPVIR